VNLLGSVFRWSREEVAAVGFELSTRAAYYPEQTEKATNSQTASAEVPVRKFVGTEERDETEFASLIAKQEQIAVFVS
jgi:hypothetical protein